MIGNTKWTYPFIIEHFYLWYILKYDLFPHPSGTYSIYITLWVYCVLFSIHNCVIAPFLLYIFSFGDCMCVVSSCLFVLTIPLYVGSIDFIFCFLFLYFYLSSFPLLLCVDYLLVNAYLDFDLCTHISYFLWGFMPASRLDIVSVLHLCQLQHII